jgi:hypothetical protein
MMMAKSHETEIRGMTIVRTMLMPAQTSRATPMRNGTTRTTGSHDPKSASSAHVTPRE